MRAADGSLELAGWAGGVERRVSVGEQALDKRDPACSVGLYRHVFQRSRRSGLGQKASAITRSGFAIAAREVCRDLLELSTRGENFAPLERRCWAQRAGWTLSRLERALDPGRE